MGGFAKRRGGRRPSDRAFPRGARAISSGTTPPPETSAGGRSFSKLHRHDLRDERCLPSACRGSARIVVSAGAKAHAGGDSAGGAKAPAAPGSQTAARTASVRRGPTGPQRRTGPRGLSAAGFDRFDGSCSRIGWTAHVDGRAPLPCQPGASRRGGTSSLPLDNRGGACRRPPQQGSPDESERWKPRHGGKAVPRWRTTGARGRASDPLRTSYSSNGRRFGPNELGSLT